MRQLPTFYCLNCPVCGRPLRVKMKMMGDEVCCSHCMASFVAESAVQRNTIARRTSGIDRRVEAMLAVRSEEVSREESDFWNKPGSHKPVASPFYEYQK